MATNFFFRVLFDQSKLKAQLPSLQNSARMAGTSIGRAYSDAYKAETSKIPVDVNNHSKVNRFLNQKSKLLSMTNNDGTKLINAKLLEQLGTKGDQAINSFIGATVAHNPMLSLKSALQNPSVMASRMGSQDFAVLTGLISKDYDKRMSTHMIAAVRMQKLKELSTPAQANAGIAQLQNIRNQRNMINSLQNFKAPSQQQLNDLARGRFNNLGYGIGGMLGGTMGGALMAGAGGLMVAQGVTRNLANRDEVYREIKSYMSGSSSKDITDRFNAGLRETLNATTVAYGISFEELSKFVIESLQSGVAEDSVQSMLPEVAKIARAYNVSMTDMVELMTTAQLSDWINPDDIKSVNVFFGKLIEMVKVSKATMRGFSESLKYTPALREAGVDSDSYIAMTAMLANQNIRGTRAGRTMDAIFSKILVPDGDANSVKASLVGALSNDGKEDIGIGTDELQKLSEFLAALKFSVYDTKGNIKVGKGKQYANWTEAFVGLGSAMKNFSDSDSNRFASYFGQIARRGVLPLLKNVEELSSMFDKIINADVLKNLQIAQNISDDSLSVSSNKLGENFKKLTDDALALEDSFGILRFGLDLLSGALNAVGTVMDSFGVAFSSEYRESKRKRDATAVLNNQADMYAVALNRMVDVGYIKPTTKLEELSPENMKTLQYYLSAFPSADKETIAKARQNFDFTPQDIQNFNLSRMDNNTLAQMQQALNQTQGLVDKEKFILKGGVVNPLNNFGGGSFADYMVRNKMNTLVAQGINPTDPTIMSQIQSRLNPQQNQELSGSVKIIIEDPFGKRLATSFAPISTKMQTNPASITVQGPYKQGGTP